MHTTLVKYAANQRKLISMIFSTIWIFLQLYFTYNLSRNIWKSSDVKVLNKVIITKLLIDTRTHTGIYHIYIYLFTYYIYYILKRLFDTVYIIPSFIPAMEICSLAKSLNIKGLIENALGAIYHCLSMQVAFLSCAVYFTSPVCYNLTCGLLRAHK